MKIAIYLLMLVIGCSGIVVHCINSKKKYAYCVMWQSNTKKGMTEILRDSPIKTYSDALGVNEFLQEYQKEDSLVIINWKTLGRRYPTPEFDGKSAKPNTRLSFEQENSNER